MKIDVRADTTAVEKDLRKVHRKLAPQAAAQALNRVNVGIRGAAVKAASRRLNIKPQKRVRRRLFRPKERRFFARPDRLNAGGVALFRFVPEIYTLRGARTGRGPLAGTGKFVAEVRGSRFQATSDATGKQHRGIFRRMTRKRLPIKERFINVESETARVIDHVLETEGADRWRKAFTAAIRNKLRRVR